MVSFEAAQETASRLRAELGRAIIGQQAVVHEILTAFFAGGHVLLRGVPGLAKTLLIKSLARAVHLKFNRIQFTPDLMPSDIIGTEVIEEDRGTGRREIRFIRGPVFANVILADEINRTPPKTQAALLEAMQEKMVTAGNTSYTLEEPFFVLATQNPIEQEGTYPLPEAQLDRFAARIRLGYLDEAGEAEMARRRLDRGSAPPRPAEVLDASALLAMRESLEQVHLDDDLLGYIVRLVAATRSHPQITVGASPRGTLAVIQLARGHAALDSRDYVIPEDVKAVAVAALAHRLVLRPEMWVRRVTGEDLITEILTDEPVPRASQ